jgi:hypothetical protein
MVLTVLTVAAALWGGHGQMCQPLSREAKVCVTVNVRDLARAPRTPQPFTTRRTR